ncbi:MAG: DUF1836 domain-containing protein, partial [Oscillospiraceae bacterium]
MQDENMTQHELLVSWAKVMVEHALPAWEDFPTIELYMDQVVILIAQYLSHMGPMLDEDKPVTPAMINNYVKMGLLAPPIKKRYNRNHLACLIMVCVLKRSLTMSAIQKLLSPGMSEEQIHSLYESFRINRRRGIEYVAQQVFEWSGEIFRNDAEGTEEQLVIRLAVMASLFKIS